MNGKKPLTLDYKTFVQSTGLDCSPGTYVSHLSPEAVKAELAKIITNPSYLDKIPVLKNAFPVPWRILFTFVIQVLSGNYSSIEYVNSIQQMIAYYLITGTKDENFMSLPGILSNSNFSKDPSKVTEIELMALMIASQGPEALGALSKKRNKPKSKKHTPETQVTPPSVPTKDFEKTQSASLGQTAHPQDTEGNTQPAVKGFHSPLDKGTHKSQPLLEGTTIDPKDSGGNVQPTDKGLPFTVSDEGTVKTKPLLEGPHGDKDSKEFKPPADMEPSTTPVADP
ncbi:hypothetical protein Tco_1002407 [Tanacetum coccineum]|uniref:Uncharacterized protein n=1 Tax=Tanacetum coccineum TaxID=301880 RepID=A0ABQ5F6S8_9ASTR